ncbi:hypothetical protein [Sphingomonas telluris]|nr:hypothetical protein [Sphingomonas telluris]
MPDPKEPPAAPAEDDEDDHGARLAKAFKEIEDEPGQSPSDSTN